MNPSILNDHGGNMSKSFISAVILLCSFAAQAAQINLLVGQRTNPLWDPQSRQYVTVTCSDPYGPGPGYPPPPPNNGNGPNAMPCTAYHYDEPVTCTPQRSSQNGSQLVYSCRMSSSCAHGNIGHYGMTSVYDLQSRRWISQCQQSYSQDGC